MPRGRQPKTIPTVERKINLPEALDAELQLLLWSDIDGRVPYGALTNLVVPLLQQYLQALKATRQKADLEGLAKEVSGD